MSITVTTDSAGVPLQVTDETPDTPQHSGDRTIARDLAIGRNLSVAGTLTPSAGVVGSAKSYPSTIPIGSVAYGSLGTDGVMVANTIYVGDIFVPVNTTLTGIGMLQGSTSATDKYIYYLFAAAGGPAIATTDLTGTIADGATNAFLEIPFTAPYAAIGPARYWIGVQCNGTTTKNRKVAASTYLLLCKSYTSTGFGTVNALTVPTSFAATTAPIAYVY